MAKIRHGGAGGIRIPNAQHGDVIYNNGTNWTNLGAGATGGFLQTQGVGANPQWWGGVQGDVLYHNGVSWVNLGAGLTGGLLQTAGPAANPAWIGGIQGDVLYHNGAAWANLGPGVAGQFLQTAGPAANPAWAAVATTYIRSRTLVVAATNSIDTTNADYFCDGVADEVQINAAITALAATGGSVCLMEGTFTLSSAILMNQNNVSLIGQGKGTQLVGGSFRSVDVGANKTGMLVKNIYFIGNDNSSGYGVYLDADNSRVESCWFLDCYYGVRLLENQCTVANCYFESGNYGVYVAATANTVVGCTMLNCTFGVLTNSNSCSVVGCSSQGGS